MSTWRTCTPVSSVTRPAIRSRSSCVAWRSGTGYGMPTFTRRLAMFPASSTDASGRAEKSARAPIPIKPPEVPPASVSSRATWLAIFSRTFPFVRKLAAFVLGSGGGTEPFLWGEALWNDFGGFHYVSGFVGYVLLGFYFRKFVPELSWRKTLLSAVPLWLVGWAFICLVFLCRIPLEEGWPVKGPLSLALDLELGWRTCTTGVALTAAGAFLVIRKLTTQGAFYHLVIRPLAGASFGTYLAHMLVLVPVLAWIRPHFPTPVTMVLAAVLTFVLTSLLSLVLGRLPFVGRFIAP